MTILFLNLYSGINNRGAEIFVHQLAIRLVKKHRVTLVGAGKIELPGVESIKISSSSGQPQEQLSSNPIDRLRKRLFLDAAGLSILSFALKTFPLLWKRKFDLVIPVNGFWLLLICKIVAFLRGGKTLVTGHSGPFWDERWNLYLKPNVFVATTKPTQIWAKSVCPWTRVEVIPYGVDLQKFRNAKATKIPLEKPIILCPSAAVAYKRVDLAIKAIAHLQLGSLLHLGTGVEKASIKKLGHELLGENRFLTDSASPEEMPICYASCDVVTLPSTKQENSPMVFLEALAAGKPIVVTNSLRARWILGEAGHYVDPENIDEYAAALRQAYMEHDPKKILAQAEKYSWDKIIEEYEQLIKTL